MKDFIKIHEKDNVIVALKNFPAGKVIDLGDRKVMAAQDVPAGHKMAICDVKEGGEVIKYGYRIGIAKEPIREGEWVHVHNLKTALGNLLEYDYEPVESTFHAAKDCKNQTEAFEGATFQGYVRADGSVGVRNEIWIIPTVGCVNNVAKGKCLRSRKRRGGYRVSASLWMFPDGRGSGAQQGDPGGPDPAP